ncbi:MAG: hypothetical protein Q8N98_04000 [bacterium]|nr:hypothetical protein [bacterium]
MDVIETNGEGSGGANGAESPRLFEITVTKGQFVGQARGPKGLMEALARLGTGDMVKAVDEPPGIKVVHKMSAPAPAAKTGPKKEEPVHTRPMRWVNGRMVS